jgi:hypothetical protein
MAREHQLAVARDFIPKSARQFQLVQTLCLIVNFHWLILGRFKNIVFDYTLTIRTNLIVTLLAI